MRLDKFEYKYMPGLTIGWKIEDCEFNNINLIVGKNASGKSTIVQKIYIISELLTKSGLLKSSAIDEEWYLFFDTDNPNKKTEYLLKLENGYVIEERLVIGGNLLLERKKKYKGDETIEGEIWAEELKNKIRFQTPKTELAVVARRDKIQHPFLEDIYQWAYSLRFYEFGSQLGKNSISRISTDRHYEKPGGFTLIPSDQELINNTSLKDYNNVVKIFLIGQKEFSQDQDQNFIKMIIDDMNKIGYDFEEIKAEIPMSPYLRDSSLDEDFVTNLNNVPYYLFVKEKNVQAWTEQSQMSQGMFRALSLIIQINYSLLANNDNCIIIDDIGEGLDYERASAIIKLLIEKAETSSVQLIMTTNDQFIMNGVPLEYWSVIERKPKSIKLYNKYNAKEKFEEFEFIGLNNFDFFISEFAIHGFSEEE